MLMLNVFSLSRGLEISSISAINISTYVYNTNFPPLMDELKLDLERLNNLHISIAGRVNRIKMIVPPCFLYIF